MLAKDFIKQWSIISYSKRYTVGGQAYVRFYYGESWTSGCYHGYIYCKDENKEIDKTIKKLSEKECCPTTLTRPPSSEGIKLDPTPKHLPIPPCMGFEPYMSLACTHHKITILN